MEDSEVIFERVLHSVGEDGRFQRRYNAVFNFALSCVGTMAYMNIILIMVTPNHWCRVPGNEEHNYTEDEWKRITIPREKNILHQEVYNSCEMYYKNNTYAISNGSNVTECIFGYNYDYKWFTNSFITFNNWTCSRKISIMHLFAMIKLSEVIGGLIMGYLADVIGRRSVFFISLILILIGRYISPFVSELYPVFAVASIIAHFPSTSIAQSCLVIIMEVSPPENREMIMLIQNLGWSLGMCILPLMFWLCQDWTIYYFVSTTPLGIYIFLSIFLIESPRWLLYRGRIGECLQQLKNIAKVNNTKVSGEGALMLQNSKTSIPMSYSVSNLFSSRTIMKNLLMLILVWISCMVNYSTLVMIVIILDGNPFLNFFILSLVEMPSYLFGKIICNRLGRRFTAIFAFLLSITSYVVLIVNKNDSYKTIIHITMIALSKFSILFSYYVINLQGLEIFPICIRQNAITIGNTLGSIFSILAPYIIYLGVAKEIKLLYIILLLLSLIGIIAEIFLPETLNERLPDTLQEAKLFGKDQHYWNLPHRKKDPTVLASIRVIRRYHSEICDSDN